jgi:hypothetical protein
MLSAEKYFESAGRKRILNQRGGSVRPADSGFLAIRPADPPRPAEYGNQKFVVTKDCCDR